MTNKVPPPEASDWVPVVGEKGYEYIRLLWEDIYGDPGLIFDIELFSTYQTTNNSLFLEDDSFSDDTPTFINETEDQEDIGHLHFPKEWRSVTVSADYTAHPFDFLAVTHPVTVKLPAYPDSDDIVTCLNVNGKNIIYNGNGNLINGETNIISKKKNTALNFHYFSELESWYMR